MVRLRFGFYRQKSKAFGILLNCCLKQISFFKNIQSKCHRKVLHRHEPKRKERNESFVFITQLRWEIGKIAEHNKMNGLRNDTFGKYAALSSIWWAKWIKQTGEWERRKLIHYDKDDFFECHVVIECRSCGSSFCLFFLFRRESSQERERAKNGSTD